MTHSISESAVPLPDNRHERMYELLVAIQNALKHLPRTKQTYDAIEAKSLVLGEAYKLPEGLTRDQIRHSERLYPMYREARFGGPQQPKLDRNLRGAPEKVLEQAIITLTVERDDALLRNLELERQLRVEKMAIAAEAARLVLNGIAAAKSI